MRRLRRYEIDCQRKLSSCTTRRRTPYRLLPISLTSGTPPNKSYSPHPIHCRPLLASALKSSAAFSGLLYGEFLLIYKSYELQRNTFPLEGTRRLKQTIVLSHACCSYSLQHAVAKLF